MSSRSLQQRLQDILDQAEEILAFADGLDYEAFCADSWTTIQEDLPPLIEQVRELIENI